MGGRGDAGRHEAFPHDDWGAGRAVLRTRSRHMSIRLTVDRIWSWSRSRADRFWPTCLYWTCHDVPAHGGARPESGSGSGWRNELKAARSQGELHAYGRTDPGRRSPRSGRCPIVSRRTMGPRNDARRTRETVFSRRLPMPAARRAGRREAFSGLRQAGQGVRLKPRRDFPLKKPMTRSPNSTEIEPAFVQFRRCWLILMISPSASSRDQEARPLRRIRKRAVDGVPSSRTRAGRSRISGLAPASRLSSQFCSAAENAGCAGRRFRIVEEPRPVCAAVSTKSIVTPSSSTRLSAGRNRRTPSISTMASLGFRRRLRRRCPVFEAGTAARVDSKAAEAPRLAWPSTRSIRRMKRCALVIFERHSRLRVACPAQTAAGVVPAGQKRWRAPCCGTICERSRNAPHGPCRLLRKPGCRTNARQRAAPMRIIPLDVQPVLRNRGRRRVWRVSSAQRRSKWFNPPRRA